MADITGRVFEYIFKCTIFNIHLTSIIQELKARHIVLCEAAFILSK